MMWRVECTEEEKRQFLIAAKEGNLDAVKNLLTDTSIDVDATDDYGMTALMWASMRGNIKIVEAILGAEKVDVNFVDKYKNTALIIASKNNNIKIVEAILGAEKVDVNLEDDFGNTALIIASSNGYLGIVEAILGATNLEDEVNVNFQIRYSGNTALMIASSKGHHDVVKAILGATNLKSQVDINLKDKDGNTAMKNASRRGQIDIVKFLALFQSTIDPKSVFEDDICSQHRGLIEEFLEFCKTHNVDENKPAEKVRIIEEYIKFREFCDSKEIYMDGSLATRDAFIEAYLRFQGYCDRYLKLKKILSDQEDEVLDAIMVYLQVKPLLNAVLAPYTRDFYDHDSESIEELYERFLVHDEEKKSEREKQEQHVLAKMD